MDESIKVLRIRAELARRIAGQMYDGTARRELLQIAGDLDAEADKMEQAKASPNGD